MPVTPKRMSAGHPQTTPLMVLLMFVIVVNISCSFPFPSSSKKDAVHLEPRPCVL